MYQLSPNADDPELETDILAADGFSGTVYIGAVRVDPLGPIRVRQSARGGCIVQGPVTITHISVWYHGTTLPLEGKCFCGFELTTPIVVTNKLAVVAKTGASPYRVDWYVTGF